MDKENNDNILKLDDENNDEINCNNEADKKKKRIILYDCRTISKYKIIILMIYNQSLFY